MKIRLMWVAAVVLSGAASVTISADQTPALNKVMQSKLAHAQQILAAVIRSDWARLDRESRALATVVRDPAWTAAMTAPEYIRQSDVFSRALQDLIEASAKRDLEMASDAQVSLTMSCVRCHLYMSRSRLAK